MNGSSSFSIKKQKNKTNNLKILLFKKSEDFKEITWIRIHFFPERIQDRIRNRIKLKWILSTGVN